MNWDDLDANLSETRTKILYDNGWQEETLVYEGVNTTVTAPVAASSSRRLLSTYAVSGGGLPLQSSTTTITKGATVMDTSYLEPANKLTRSYQYIDGQLRLSVTSYNGLSVLYSTNGTTYSNKIASYTPLRELLSNVDGASGYWTKTNRTPSTGLPSALLLASGTTKQTFAYITGDDVRSSRNQRNYKRKAYKRKALTTI